MQMGVNTNAGQGARDVSLHRKRIRCRMHRQSCWMGQTTGASHQGRAVRTPATVAMTTMQHSPTFGLAFTRCQMPCPRPPRRVWTQPRTQPWTQSWGWPVLLQWMHMATALRLASAARARPTARKLQRKLVQQAGVHGILKHTWRPMETHRGEPCTLSIEVNQLYHINEFIRLPGASIHTAQYVRLRAPSVSSLVHCHDTLTLCRCFPSKLYHQLFHEREML